MSGRVSDRIKLYLAAALVLTGCSDDDVPKPQEAGVVDQRVVDSAADRGATADTGATADKGGSDLSTAPFKTCQRQCTKDDDCCQTPPCDTMPKNSVCQSSGTCFNRGCTADTDCRSGSGLSCLTFLNMGLCGLPCTTDAQCAGGGAANVCVAKTYCGNAATKQAFSCTSNADCSATLAEDTCHGGSGYCGCSNDANCQAQYAPAYGGMWKCVAFKL